MSRNSRRFVNPGSVDRFRSSACCSTPLSALVGRDGGGGTVPGSRRRAASRVTTRWLGKDLDGSAVVHQGGRVQPDAGEKGACGCGSWRTARRRAGADSDAPEALGEVRAVLQVLNAASLKGL